MTPGSTRATRSSGEDLEDRFIRSSDTAMPPCTASDAARLAAPRPTGITGTRCALAMRNTRGPPRRRLDEHRHVRRVAPRSDSSRPYASSRSGVREPLGREARRAAPRSPAAAGAHPYTSRFAPVIAAGASSAANTTTRATSSGVIAGRERRLLQHLGVGAARRAPRRTARRARELLGEALREPDEPPLRRVVRARPGRADRRRDRRHVHDAAATARLHPGITARAHRNAPVRFTSSTSRNAARRELLGEPRAMIPRCSRAGPPGRGPARAPRRAATSSSRARRPHRERRAAHATTRSTCGRGTREHRHADAALGERARHRRADPPPAAGHDRGAAPRRGHRLVPSPPAPRQAARPSSLPGARNRRRAAVPRERARPRLGVRARPCASRRGRSCRAAPPRGRTPRRARRGARRARPRSAARGPPAARAGARARPRAARAGRSRPPCHPGRRRRARRRATAGGGAGRRSGSRCRSRPRDRARAGIASARISAGSRA